MLQSPDALNLPSELRDALSSLMHGATFEEQAVREDCLPVVLMSHSHSLTAFAIGDETDYEPLYAAFKKLYLKRTAEWSTKDVSFAFCLSAETPVHESFRSRVEVDVYFCRKYVLQLEQDLIGSLARLPFLPLSPVAQGGQARPPSAQTLLQQRNLKAELARALVVPAKSSASSILAACLEGAYGVPEKIAKASDEPAVQVDPEERVQATLKSVSIQNFRAYRAKKEFSLGSAVTILYGPNGFGKTSFFDAVDFVVTGGVGRLARVSGGLAKAAKHLESDDESTVVSLTLERGGTEHVVTRDLADHNNARVNGKATSRKDVLSLLAGGAPAAADRVDNMVSLFRATHLFSQDRQELTRDVAEKCELPAHIVSSMLAFEDYVSGLKKADEVLKLARLTLSTAQNEAKNARGTIAAERLELERLQGLAAADTSPDVLNARFAEVEQAMLAAGLDPAGINIRDTKTLRAMLESYAAEAVSSRLAVSKALGHVADLRTLRAQLENISRQLEESKARVEETEVSAKATSERLTSLTSELAQFQSEEKGVQNQRDWLAWAVPAQPEFTQLTAQRQTLNESLSTLNQRLNEERENQSNALSVHQNAVAALQHLESTLKAAIDAKVRFLRMQEEAATWAQAEPRLVSAQVFEVQLRASLEFKRTTFAEIQQAVIEQESLVTRVERELDAARINDTGLQKLISELRTHVNAATCLLCGHDHGSQDALLAAIDCRMAQSDQVVRLNEIFAIERTKVQSLLAGRQALSDEILKEERQLGSTQTEREELERQREKFVVAASSIGLSLSNDFSQLLAQKSTQAHEEEMLAATAVNNARSQVAVAEAALATVQQVYQALERDRQAAATSLQETTERLDQLHSDASRGSINFAAGLPALVEQLSQLDVRLIQASLTVRIASAALDAQKANQAAANASLVAARTNQQQAAQILSTYTTNEQTLMAALSAAGFGREVSGEQMHQRIQDATVRETTALHLRDRVADLEVAVDTAATSVAFQNLRARISASEILVAQADERAKKVAPWVTYFEDVTKLLGSQQAVATEQFIKQYGPRTAVIQQRLRPVYGFGEIVVSSKDSAIDIRVHRRGQELRPTDYFSQSQVQTLVLGLFLTACSSQTWSGFSSIMMDDPVTHFDDLNTYALLDLILGFHGSPEGQRQFVISTCDEKLLQLARQKLRHMGDAAKFYRFSAIGADGPMVSEIPA